MDEKHLVIDDKPVSGALMDFGLYFFHNVQIRLAKQSAPYYYLPKMEHHLEARLWNEVFKFSEDYLKVAQGEKRCGRTYITLLSLNNVKYCVNIVQTDNIRL